MKVKFVLQMEIDDAYAVDDDTGERLSKDDLIVRLKEDLSVYDIPIEIDEITSVEIFSEEYDADEEAAEADELDTQLALSEAEYEAEKK